MMLLRDQIREQLTSAEQLVAVTSMSRPDHVGRRSVAAGRALLCALSRDNGLPADRPLTLAEQLRHYETMYGVVTSLRVAFFADHPYRLDSIGPAIVGYLPTQLRGYELALRKVVDSTIRLDFADRSSATMILKRRRDISAWVDALDSLAVPGGSATIRS